MHPIRYGSWLSAAALFLFVAAPSADLLAQEARGMEVQAGERVVMVPPTTGAVGNGPIEGSWIESFEDIALLPDAGWFTQNNSNPVGTTTWFQGTEASPFPPHDGGGFIGANFNAASGSGDISNWLLTPEIVIQDGTQMSFWTRTVASSNWPDRLQVRLSMAGSSVNVGSGSEDVGDFDILLVDINEGYSLGGYPESWTEFVFDIDGLDDPVSGRFAFRYYVHNGGPSGNNSNYIGIDLVTVSQPAVSTEPGTVAGEFALSSVYPNPVSSVSSLTLDLGVSQHVSVEVFNLLGQRVATVFTGVAPAGTSTVSLDASAFSTGMYIVRVVGEDFAQSRRFVVSH